MDKRKIRFADQMIIQTFRAVRRAFLGARWVLSSACLGSFWGSMKVVGQQCELVTPSESNLDPPGPILELLLGSMLAPCWPMLGLCWGPCGVLGAS